MMNSKSQGRMFRFWYFSLLTASFLSAFFFVLVFLNVGIAEAFPFSISSGVVELTPKSLNQFVSTHKPVYILFYAPWCGHCRNIHPEWEKFAKAVQGTIHVGAINADEHKEISHKFGIRGFPTIKYWQVGEKKIDKSKDYEGQRHARAIQASAMGLVSSNRVKNFFSADELRDAVQKADGKYVVVLFSSKMNVPATFSVLSLSPRLKSMPFYFVGGHAKGDVAQEFGVTQLPSIAVLNVMDGEIKTDLYKEKEFAYESIEKFLTSFVTDDPNARGAEENDDGGVTGSEKTVRTLPPLAPARLSRNLLDTFCSPVAIKSGEPSRLCVVSLTSAFSLNDVYKSFSNEPILFFEGHADREVFLKFLDDQLKLTGFEDTIRNEKENNVFFFRVSKTNTLHYMIVGGIDSDTALNVILQKVMTGELSLLKKTM